MKCSCCNGRGFYTSTRYSSSSDPDEGTVEEEITCTNCNGTGEEGE